MPRWISSRMTPPVSRFTASSSRIGQGRPATGRRVGPRRLMRQPAPLPSWYTPGRTCPGPLAARPTDSPRVVRLLVSLRGENTQHRQPGRETNRCPTPPGRTRESGNDSGEPAKSSPRSTATIRGCPGTPRASGRRAPGPLVFAAGSPRPHTRSRADEAHSPLLASDRPGRLSQPPLFFVPGRAEKPQEPRPPGESPRPSPHAPHGRLPHAVEWATGIRQQLELR